MVNLCVFNELFLVKCVCPVHGPKTAVIKAARSAANATAPHKVDDNGGHLYLVCKPDLVPTVPDLVPTVPAKEVTLRPG